MEDYEYKVIPAPARTVKVKGLKTTGERFAHLLTEALNREAEQGWTFLRAESLPCEERKGLTGTARSTQTVLIFRRTLQELSEQTNEFSQPAQRSDRPRPVPVPPLHENAPQAPGRAGAPVSAHPVPSFRSEPSLGHGAPPADEAGKRREPAMRASRYDDDGH